MSAAVGPGAVGWTCLVPLKLINIQKTPKMGTFLSGEKLPHNNIQTVVPPKEPGGKMAKDYHSEQTFDFDLTWFSKL